MQVQLVAPSDATDIYLWDDRSIEFHRCEPLTSRDRLVRLHPRGSPQIRPTGDHLKTGQQTGSETGVHSLLVSRALRQVAAGGAVAPRPAFEDVGVVAQAVEHRRDSGVVAEELAPVVDGAVGREQGAGALVAARLWRGSGATATSTSGRSTSAPASRRRRPPSTRAPPSPSGAARSRLWRTPMRLTPTSRRTTLTRRRASRWARSRATASTCTRACASRRATTWARESSCDTAAVHPCRSSGCAGCPVDGWPIASSTWAAGGASSAS